MGYMHINNLYKDQRILQFPECYALEKIHGTSGHVQWKNGALEIFPGGEKLERVSALFDKPALIAVFGRVARELPVTVYGEIYGGSQQKQTWRYGDKLRFVAFEVQSGDLWLPVPEAGVVASVLGLEFVHYRRVPTTLAALDAERDAPSEQAKRNGVEGDKPREGVVLRPLVEMVDEHGHRVIAKHKRDEERETGTPRPVTAERLNVLVEAGRIADEWVTPTRLEHVLDHLRAAAAANGVVALGVEQTGGVIAAMTEDILREGAGEWEDTREARAAIGRKTALMFKNYLKNTAQERIVTELVQKIEGRQNG